MPSQGQFAEHLTVRMVRFRHSGSPPLPSARPTGASPSEKASAEYAAATRNGIRMNLGVASVIRECLVSATQSIRRTTLARLIRMHRLAPGAATNRIVDLLIECPARHSPSARSAAEGARAFAGRASRATSNCRCARLRAHRRAGASVGALKRKHNALVCPNFQTAAEMPQGTRKDDVGPGGCARAATITQRSAGRAR